jgi:hypothetical protein
MLPHPDLFNSHATRRKIIKTVGEFVMGVFTTGEAAVKAFAQVLDSPKGRIFPPVTRSTGLNPIPTRFL